jgi:hypothetical protein
MLKIASLIVAFVLFSTLASHAKTKTWESMNANERISWAMRQVGRLCPHGAIKVTAEEKASAMHFIAYVDQGTVESMIRGRCDSASASR